MRRAWIITVFVGLAGLAGCEADQKILEADQANYDAWQMQRAVLDKGLAAWMETEDSRNRLERAVIDGDIDQALARFADAEGRLVAETDEGLQPISLAEVKRIIQERERRVIEAEVNHRRNVAAIERVRAAVEKYAAAQEVWISKKADWYEKKRGAAAAFNAALEALGGGGLGLLIGGLAM